MGIVGRLDLEHPVVQAGMGGGIAGAPLAGAVSAAGGLGTLGIMPPRAFAPALREARARAGAGRPVAANLLLPFTRPAHVAACIEARVAVVVLHAGREPGVVRQLRAAGIDVLHTVGTAAEAREAQADGVSGLVVQGTEAGGHTVAERELVDAVAAVRAVSDLPVWAAGGIATAEDARAAIAAGAEAVVAGSRFVMTDECGVHPGWKTRMMRETQTVETMLFGFGWPMRHRVLVNAAVRRWPGSGPGPVAALNARTARLGGLLPLGLMAHYPKVQSARLPLFTAGPALAGMPERVLDVTPLYAGRSVERLHDVVPAAEAVTALSP